MKKASYYMTCRWIAIVVMTFLIPSHLTHAEDAASQDSTPSAMATVTIHADQPGTKISPDLFGIFFEDLNYAADGGLYAELVQNRSFEYYKNENRGWHSLTSWELVTRGGGKGEVTVETAEPLNDRNPHYAVLTVENGGTGVGLMNSGFDVMVIKAGEKYDVSFFARRISGPPAPLVIRLESKTGVVFGEAAIPALNKDWTKYTAAIQADNDDEDGRLVVTTTGTGTLALDVISLFPQKTFRNRRNGLRADLAQVIADLKPKFMRFPGGCLVHGDGLENMYRWKDTIGPVEERKEQRNIWSYHQTVGLGYYEYFQFCEDIGAKPLPVVPAGVCCQNSGRNWGKGQKGLPLEQMPDYIQEVLDLIEYANGPAASTWGAKRAAAGHPEPFHLQYLAVGNEDAQTPVFRERFKMISNAVKAKHPEITVIGTVGPAPDGFDFEEGWKFANELKVEMVDEHYYKKPEWFLQNLKRYDSYSRDASKIYLGEYAAHEDNRQNTLRSALAEAAYMTSLERNGDLVRFASYAPLLGRDKHTQWNPNLIYFTATKVRPTVNYYVQQLFSTNQGDIYLPNTVSLTPPVQLKESDFVVSAVKDTKTGDIILKMINVADIPLSSHVNISGLDNLNPAATKTILTGELKAVNTSANPRNIIPVTSDFTIGKSFAYDAPPHSLTVIRMRTRQ